jgi:hypothetical protein
MFKFLIFNFRITNNYEGKYWIFKEYFICWNENELIIWQTCVVATNVFFILCLYYKIRFFFILKKKFLFFITRCKHIPLSLYICVPYTNTSPSLGGFIPLFPFGAHHLCWSLTLGGVGEYACVVKALTPSTLTLTSLETITTLQTFHLSNSSLPCLDSLMEFQLKLDLDFSLNMFKLFFIHSTHLSIRGP